jgi:rRNA processing protein Krr1/Pno1
MNELKSTPLSAPSSGSKIVAIEQKVANLDVQVPLMIPINQNQPVVEINTDGWEIVEDKRKQKLAVSAQTTALSNATHLKENHETAPVVETIKSSVSVDAKKVGVLIGPKGSTLHQLQDLFHVEIITPKEKESAVTPPSNSKAPVTAPATINVIGAAENVTQAIKAITELCTKGYTACLEGSDFKEGHISILPMYNTSFYIFIDRICYCFHFSFIGMFLI